MFKLILELMAMMFIAFVLILTYALCDTSARYDRYDDEWRDKTK